MPSYIKCLVLFFALLLTSSCCHKAEYRQLPRYIALEQNNLKNCRVPVPPDLKVVREEEAIKFFQKVQDENVEWKYAIGNCEDRAQFLSLMLQKSHIQSGKVWLIPPARYTLLSRQLLKFVDPFVAGNYFTWGYHVASIIKVEGTGIVVIDPTVSPLNYLKLADWLAEFDTPLSIYFMTGEDEYLFNSLDGLKVYDNISGKNRLPVTLPDWMPNILSGHFQKYSFITRGMDVADGMALSDASRYVFEKWVLSNPNIAERNSLLPILHNTDQLREFLRNGNVEDISPEITLAARTHYNARLSYWLAKVKALSQ